MTLNWCSFFALKWPRTQTLMASCGCLAPLGPFLNRKPNLSSGKTPLQGFLVVGYLCPTALKLLQLSAPATVSVATLKMEYGFLIDLLNFSSKKNKLKS